MMRLYRVVLLVFGIACTVVFFSFGYTATITEEGRVWELRVGLQTSPWILQEVRAGEGSASVFNLLSWSTVIALVAGACFWGYARLSRSDSQLVAENVAALPGAGPPIGG